MIRKKDRIVFDDAIEAAANLTKRLSKISSYGWSGKNAGFDDSLIMIPILTDDIDKIALSVERLRGIIKEVRKRRPDWIKKGDSNAVLMPGVPYVVKTKKGGIC